MIKNIIIVGVGNIGFRHLESLLKIKRKLRVIVCDQSTYQLKKTKEKITIINKKKHCVYCICIAITVIPHLLCYSRMSYARVLYGDSCNDNDENGDLKSYAVTKTFSP